MNKDTLFHRYSDTKIHCFTHTLIYTDTLFHRYSDTQIHCLYYCYCFMFERFLEIFWFDRFSYLSLRDFLNEVLRYSLNRGLNRFLAATAAQEAHLYVRPSVGGWVRNLVALGIQYCSHCCATLAICNNLQHLQFATLTICNTCNLQHVQFESRAICNM